MVKKRFSIIPKRMKSNYGWGDKVPASGIYECSLCNNLHAFKKEENFSQCDDCIKNNEEKENRWYVTNEFYYFMSKNMNIEFDKISSLQTKFANLITDWAGNMWFVYFHIIWFAIWVLMNLNYWGPEYVFDPFPFGLLTMIVSLEAIFLATFIMISQNISGQKSELRAEHEYQINLDTEKNVAEILAMLKEIKKENELKSEAIEEIKDTIEEISEPLQDKIEEAIEETRTENINPEMTEAKEFEEHEKLLDEAGIDVMPESAPPIILEENEIIEGEGKSEETMKKEKKSRRKKLASRKNKYDAKKGNKKLEKTAKNKDSKKRKFKK